VIEERGNQIRCFQDRELRPEPEPLVWPLVYPGRITLLAGRENSGKSWLAAGIASAMANGGRFLGRQLSPSATLFLGMDESEEDTHRNLLDFGPVPWDWSLRYVEAPGAAPTVNLMEDLKDDQVCRDKWGTENVGEAPAILVVDSFSQLLARTDRQHSENEATATTTVVRLLQDLQRIHPEMAILILHHTTKKTGQSRGSSAITAAVDVVATLKNQNAVGKEDGSRTLQVEKARRGWTGTLRIRLEGEKGSRSYELMDSAKERQVKLEKEILAYLDAHPGESTTRIVDEIAGRSTTIRETVKALTQAGRIVTIQEGQTLRHYPEGWTQ